MHQTKKLLILTNWLTDSEEEIICDLAEYYHILYYQELPPSLVATLVVGLPDTARIKKKKANIKITLDQALLARLLDSMQMLMWGMQKRRGAKPKSIYEKLIEDKAQKDELLSFASPEDYENWRKRKKESWQCQKSQPLMSR